MLYLWGLLMLVSFPSLSYPSRSFSLSWETIPWLRYAWGVLTEFRLRCRVVRLPLYFPTPAEVADPSLYARNVQQVKTKPKNAGERK